MLHKHKSDDHELQAALRVQREDMDQLKKLLSDQFLISSGSERVEILHDLFYNFAASEQWTHMDQSKRENIAFQVRQLSEFLNSLDKYRDVLNQN